MNKPFQVAAALSLAFYFVPLGLSVWPRLALAVGIYCALEVLAPGKK